MDINLNQTALKETLVAVKQCFEYKKNGFDWGHSGVLGFPAAILLLSFIDAAGFLLLIKGTEYDKAENSNPGRSFEIVRNKDYFDPILSKKQKEALYNIYRGYLIHQAGLMVDTGLLYSEPHQKKIIEKDKHGMWMLHLDGLYEACLKLYSNHEVILGEKSQQK